MHDPCLSCCELWYGTNRICYDFVLRETWHPAILLSKMLKIKSSSMIMNTYQGHMTWFKIQNLSHMLLVWTLSFIKLLWPSLRFSSCTHDQDTRTLINKTVDSYTESYAKTCFFRPPNNYYIHLSCVSLSKISYAKNNSMGYAKKRERKRKK